MPGPSRDRVKETTTSTGTGAITTSGTAATGGFQTAATAFGSSTRGGITITIVDPTSGLWEVSEGTFNGTTGFTRDTVRDGSSGPGVLVNFTAGTKDVFVTVSAEQIDRASLGMQYLQARGILGMF